MKLISLTIQNFRSFSTEQTFVFQEPGLYFLTGENQIEPRLGANGAGKSTIWDALSWVLYGKTLRGLKAGDVSNWELRKGTRVELLYEAEGSSYLVARSWGPISWTLTAIGTKNSTVDLVDDETNLLYSHLRLSYLAATHSIFMAQQQPMFLDLKAADKATLLSEVLDLNSWLDFSQVAGEKARDHDYKAASIIHVITGYEVKLSTLREMDFSKELTEWESNRVDQLEKLEVETDKLVAVANKAKAELQAQDVLRPLNVRQAELRLNTLNENWTENCKIPLRLLEQDIARYAEELTTAKREVGVCGSCGQKLPASNRPALLRQIQGRLSTAQEKREELLETSKQVQEHINQQAERTKAMTRMQNDRDYQRRELERTLSSAEKRLDQIEEELGILEQATNPYQSRVEETKAEIARLEEKTKHLEVERDRLLELSRCYAFWVPGFKELRLQLVSEALAQLETEVNACLVELGLIGWELKFDVERETKSKNLQVGFTVRVVCPTNKESAPWESWSGGESQRLRIGATMGLANLIRHATGATINLEVWDEPTQHLSGRGVDDLMASLRDRANAENLQVWVVDHRSLGFADFDSTVVVVKDEEGSYIKP